MAERNLIKDRKCLSCGEVVRGKASKLKEHGRDCKKTHAMAAAQAILDKMNADMLKSTVDMADDRVLNAEGD